MLIAETLCLSVLIVMLFRREAKIKDRLSTRPAAGKALTVGVLMLVALMFALELKLSPVRNDLTGTDSNVFLYVGRSMLAGKVPYKDLFDHKGPVLYFIEYAGLLIGSGSFTGVWAIELICAFITALFFFKIARLFTESTAVSLLSVFFVMMLSSLGFFQGGNLTEEYALPWIAVSLYYVLSYFVKGAYKPMQIIPIGAGFAFVLLLRVNMVGLWGALILAVMISLIKDKKIADVFKCALFFAIGCAVVFVPVLVYLIRTDSLRDMIEYYLLFNFSYAGSGPSLRSAAGLLFDCLKYAGVSVFFIAYAAFSERKSKSLWVDLAALALAFLSSAVGGNNYIHYGIILIPFFVLPAVISIEPLIGLAAKNTGGVKKGVEAAVAAVCCLGLIAVPAASFYRVKGTKAQPDEVCEYIEANTAEDSDVLVLGNQCSVYLKTGRKTENKFFFQEPPIKVSGEIYDEFMAELESKPSDHIILYDGYYDKSERVVAYLDGKCESGEYRLEDHNGFDVYVKER